MSLIIKRGCFCKHKQKEKKVKSQTKTKLKKLIKTKRHNNKNLSQYKHCCVLFVVLPLTKF